MYTTDKTYEDLLNMVNDLRRGNLKHDDIVIAEWIKVCVLCLVLWISLKFEGGGRLSNEQSVTMIVVIVNRNTYYNKPVISQGYKNVSALIDRHILDQTRASWPKRKS